MAGFDGTASVIGNYGGGWQPFAAGDVDGDGKNDLLFLGGTAIAYWRMDGAHVMTSTYAGNAGPGYVPFAVADYNADGTADLGWHNGQNILLWMNSGAGRYDAFTAGSFVCCWRPVGGL